MATSNTAKIRNLISDLIGKHQDEFFAIGGDVIREHNGALRVRFDDGDCNVTINFDADEDDDAWLEGHSPRVAG